VVSYFPKLFSFPCLPSQAAVVHLASLVTRATVPEQLHFASRVSLSSQRSNHTHTPVAFTKAFHRQRDKTPFLRYFPFRHAPHIDLPRCLSISLLSRRPFQPPRHIPCRFPSRPLIPRHRPWSGCILGFSSFEGPASPPPIVASPLFLCFPARTLPSRPQDPLIFFLSLRGLHLSRPCPLQITLLRTGWCRIRVPPFIGSERFSFKLPFFLNSPSAEHRLARSSRFLLADPV